MGSRSRRARDISQRDAMAHSREPRLPYSITARLISALGIPDQVLFSRGWQKYVQRMAVATMFSMRCVGAPEKVGYAAPLDVRMRGPRKDWAQDRAFGGAITDLPGYDRAALMRLWDAHQSAEPNNSWALWRSIGLNEWADLGKNVGFSSMPVDHIDHARRTGTNYAQFGSFWPDPIFERTAQGSCG